MNRLKEAIRLRGVRQHNLKNIDVTLPHQKLIALIGPSGSGKSTLAFDTIVAEAQRRYVESIDPTLRMALLTQRPDADSMEGLLPTVAIEDASRPLSHRATVSTCLGTEELLQLLFARLGEIACPGCGKPLSTKTIPQMVEAVCEITEGTRFSILAPLRSENEKSFARKLVELRRDGFLRLQIEHQTIDLNQTTEPSWPRSGLFDVVVDRLSIRPDIRQRVQESIELALHVSGGIVEVQPVDGTSFVWTEKPYCLSCHRAFPALSTRLFSFFSPQGACPRCHGTGRLAEKDDVATDAGQREPSASLSEPDPAACLSCLGTRFRPEVMCVTVLGKTLVDVHHLRMADLPAFLEPLYKRKGNAGLGQLIADPIQRRVQILTELGLQYLKLGHRVAELSQGERQRLLLARQLGSELSGLLYVMDEPVSGLHPQDQKKVRAALRHLVNAGNTVIVVEHDLETARSADYIVELGPGAGEKGGHVLAHGTLAEVLQEPRSITAPYLKAQHSLQRLQRGRVAKGPQIGVTDVTLHNLKSITVEFPLGTLIGVSGVSGSGKTTLVMHALREQALQLCATKTKTLRSVVSVDASAMGRSTLSTPASFLSVLSLLRELYASLPEARARGYSAARFSYNIKGGRCEACQGQGFTRLELPLLYGLQTECEVCHGSRYQQDVQDVRFKGLSIAAILQSSVDDAYAILQAIPALELKLSVLRSLGLGYLKLGQSALTLSGGEAQRLKLASELSRKSSGSTLYLLDHPTQGLHVTDMEWMLEGLQRLVDAGNTVVMIEYDPNVLACVDYLIELGPGAQEQGGEIHFAGVAKKQ